MGFRMRTGRYTEAQLTAASVTPLVKVEANLEMVQETKAKAAQLPSIWLL